MITGNCQINSKFNIQKALCEFERKINALVDAYNEIDKDHVEISKEVEELKKDMNYLLNLGLAKEVQKILNQWKTDGEFQKFFDQMFDTYALELKKRVVYYDTYAAMIADIADLAPGTTIITQGYYAPRDGGGAEYIQHDGQFELVVKDHVLPEWFGAKGDGIADDAAAIQKAIDLGKHINFSQGKTYLISKSLKCKSDNFLHLNFATIKAKTGFVGDYLIEYDNGVVGWSFENAGVFNGTLDGNKLTGGIKARGPRDRFNIDKLYITNITKSAIFIFSRNREFGREKEGYYGKNPSPYGAEGFNITKVKVLCNGDLLENPAINIEDSNEFTIEDTKVFGNKGGAISPATANKYGCLIIHRISTSVHMNAYLKNVAIAGFKDYGLKMYDYLYPNLTSCTFEALNNSVIFEKTHGITMVNNRFLSNSGFDKPKLQLNDCSYFNIDTSTHCVGTAQNELQIDLKKAKTGTLKSNFLCKITEDDQCQNVIYEQINQNGGAFIKGSDANGTVADFNKALFDIDCGTKRTTPIVLFHKNSQNICGIGADGNITLSNGIKILSGQGTPENNVVGRPGWIYFRSNPGNGNEVIYVKGSGYDTNTGWVAK